MSEGKGTPEAPICRRHARAGDTGPLDEDDDETPDGGVTPDEPRVTQDMAAAAAHGGARQPVATSHEPVVTSDAVAATPLGAIIVTFDGTSLTTDEAVASADEASATSDDSAVELWPSSTGPSGGSSEQEELEGKCTVRRTG